MRAHVVKRPDPVRITRDDDRLAGDLGGDVVPLLGELPRLRDELPAPPEHPLTLRRRHLGRDIDPRRRRARPRHIRIMLEHAASLARPLPPTARGWLSSDKPPSPHPWRACTCPPRSAVA